MNCQVCESIQQENLLYSDDKVFAYLSYEPGAMGHIIIAPVKHFPILENLPEELVRQLFIVANRFSVACFEALGAKGTNIIVYNGISAGQKHAHFQVHVVARNEGDGLNFQWQPKQLSEEELENVLMQLSSVEKEELPEEEEPEDEGYLLKSLRRIP